MKMCLSLFALFFLLVRAPAPNFFSFSSLSHVILLNMMEIMTTTKDKQNEENAKKRDSIELIRREEEQERLLVGRTRRISRGNEANYEIEERKRLSTWGGGEEEKDRPAMMKKKSVSARSLTYICLPVQCGNGWGREKWAFQMEFFDVCLTQCRFQMIRLEKQREGFSSNKVFFLSLLVRSVSIARFLRLSSSKVFDIR